MTQVKAPNLWSMGFTGTGIVVGNQDTGMRWTHNALKPHYRGWNGSTADHNYNWHDSIHADIQPHGTNPCGYNSMVPCDDHGHGTHTTGTTTAMTEPATRSASRLEQSGSAAATWTRVRKARDVHGMLPVLHRPDRPQRPEPEPGARPHVMNNSWGCPDERALRAGQPPDDCRELGASGIFVVVSAGNGGPSCSTVSDPPAIYDASYSTGATNTGT